jgi:hypothetical protein
MRTETKKTYAVIEKVAPPGVNEMEQNRISNKLKSFHLKVESADLTKKLREIDKNYMKNPYEDFNPDSDLSTKEL